MNNDYDPNGFFNDPGGSGANDQGASYNNAPNDPYKTPDGAYNNAGNDPYTDPAAGYDPARNAPYNNPGGVYGDPNYGYQNPPLQNRKGKSSIFIIAGLGVLVVILLVAVAFLLGQKSGSKNNNNGGGTAVTGSVGPANGSQGLTDASGQPVTADPNAGVTQAGQPATQAGQPATQPSQGTTQPSSQAPVAGVPRRLDISMSNGNLTIMEGAAFNIQYDSSVIDVTNSGDLTLIHSSVTSPNASQRHRMDVIVTVPKGYSFDSVDIQCGADKTVIRSLSTNTLSMELGAGSAVLDNLQVTGSADIQEGAGALSINSGSVANLVMQCGAGATNVRAALTGTSRIDMGAGALNLDCMGSESDYTLTFQMTIGLCYYNGNIVRSGVYGTGPNAVTINGTVGVMRVNIG
ncbi:MAG: DUF4097 family beta strand repeat protein [Clostridia bacterium]|nr:DUF4097 family beta strand repeat protein [Clostridia bacterium]